MASINLTLNTAETVGEPRSGARRFWTGREEMILRNAYPAGGLVACLDKLPGRTPSSIYRRAGQLALRAPSAAAGDAPLGPRQHYGTSEHIDDLIRRTYQNKPDKGAIKQLARSINRPRHWIRGRAVKLGIAVPRFKTAPWTDAESAIVAENAHLTPIALRRRLKRAGFQRTDTAIVVKRKRLGVTTADPDHFTAAGLAVLFGVNARVITGWIEKDWLRASRRGTARTETQNGDQWWISRIAVRRFIVANVAAVDFRKVDKTWMVEILTGADAMCPGTSSPDILFIGPVVLDALKRTATFEGRSVSLTAAEITIIQALHARHGRHVGMAEIALELWPEDADRPTRPQKTIYVLVCRIRSKLRGIGAPDLIDTDDGGCASRGYIIQSAAEPARGLGSAPRRVA